MESLKEINVLVSGSSVAVVERTSHIRARGQALDVSVPSLDIPDFTQSVVPFTLKNYGI